MHTVARPKGAKFFRLRLASSERRRPTPSCCWASARVIFIACAGDRSSLSWNSSRRYSSIAPTMTLKASRRTRRPARTWAGHQGLAEDEVSAVEAR